MNHLWTSCSNSDRISLSYLRMICLCRLFCCCVFLINHRCCARCHPTDTFIQKTKQRYNSPRSLSTKINLADMQTEIKLRPPYQLSPEDLQAVNGFSVHTPSKYKGIGRTRAAHTHTRPICSPRSYDRGFLWFYILNARLGFINCGARLTCTLLVVTAIVGCKYCWHLCAAWFFWSPPINPVSEENHKEAGWYYSWSERRC